MKLPFFKTPCHPPLNTRTEYIDESQAPCWAAGMQRGMNPEVVPALGGACGLIEIRRLGLL